MPRKNQVQKSDDFPHVLITTYAAWKEQCDAFARGDLRAMICFGPPGIGKSEQMRASFREHKTRLVIVKGHITPLEFHIKMFRAQDVPVLFDDADGLTKDPLGKRQLKTGIETKRQRKMEYRSSSKLLDEAGVPKTYYTSSPVAFLMNSLKPGEDDADLKAVISRVHAYCFVPTPVEIHKYVSTFFRDQEVFDFIGSILFQIRHLSCRTYQIALEKKRARLDWKSALLQDTDPARVELVRLLRIPDLSMDERQQLFETGGFGNRSTFFQKKKELGEIQEVPQIALSTEPVVEHDEEEFDEDDELQQEAAPPAYQPRNRLDFLPPPSSN